MTQSPSWIEEPVERARAPVWRWVLGAVLALGGVVAAVLFVLGSWNPMGLVVLRQHFANPWFGLTVVGALAYLALWLLLPIRSEARQPRRLVVRVLAAVVGLSGLLVWAVSGPWYTYETTEAATSPDGERRIVDVIQGGLRERELHVWEGSGLLTREVGSLGRPCGSVRVEFIDSDTIAVNQGFGDWTFRLDPATGQPRHEFGPRCSDGPVPATMGP